MNFDDNSGKDSDPFLPVHLVVKIRYPQNKMNKNEVETNPAILIEH